MEFKQVRFKEYPSLCASWALDIGDRAAFAGPSNSGKSLQIDILSGEAPLLSGHVVFQPDICRLAILRSGWVASDKCCTVREELSSLDPSVRRGEFLLHARPCSLVVDVVGGPCLTEAGQTSQVEVDRVQKCMEDFELDGDASLCDLCQSDLVRVSVAKLSMQQPDALLLDDATEGLDAASCNWLEDFLACKTSFKIVLVASHDRGFMDKACNKVIAIQRHETNVSTHVFNGNYTSAYLAGGDFLHFHSFSLWQPKSSGLRATQAASGFASLVARDLWDQDLHRSVTVVDVGTGTGLLSLIVAQEWQRWQKDPKPDLELWAIELDEPAARIATTNFASSPWQDRLRFVHASFQDWTPEWQSNPPSVFLCNPPYNDDLVNSRAGSEEAILSRTRALDRSFLPLEVLFDGARRQGCKTLWILWGNAEDAPVLLAAAHIGWQATRQIRFQRNPHSIQPFATAWKFELDTSKAPPACKPERIFWQDHDGTPSSAWWELVGSLYYWHLRDKSRTAQKSPTVFIPSSAQSAPL
ncbi:unnamed protein product [Durusdinium trenchii]|uniref:ABC transporter domain-containing protein n=1 Tax=Durusdinium trenchii TaxID=1381693 RepID=A0ABP0L7S9_9DINO